MGRKLFRQITKIRHLIFGQDQKADSKSRARNFQRVLKMFNEIAGALAMDEHLCIDDQIIAYKGNKSSLRQYNPKKNEEMGLQKSSAEDRA